ncbi:MAG: hypothetical protein OEW58_13965 [Gammaproteobacteria bacterium]|nr:hypothetical protein [Gammaproteobacteria bacterium]
MRLVSFDSFRTLGFEGLEYVKPELMHRHLDLLREADWVLYPEYWQVNSLVYGLGARVFPSLASYHLGHNKIEMTRYFQLVAPANIPDTLILPNTPAGQQEVLDYFPFPFVAKKAKSSRGEGVYLIQSRRQFEEYCAEVDVLYAQEFLPIDRDLRLVVIGEKVVGGYWRVRSDGGFHNNVAQGGEIVMGLLPEAAVTLVERLARQAGINHAGFDIAMVGNYPFVFEFNRLFGNQGVSELGLDLPKLIMEYLSRQTPRHPPVATDQQLA